MPRSSRIPSLGRLLDACRDPVYAIDSERRIVYANEALLAWVGLGKDELVGRAVEYHALNEQDSASAANGLCPPPTALAGQPVEGHVWRLRQDGQLTYRLGRFLPLGIAPQEQDAHHPETATDDAQRCVGVIAVLGPHDFTAADLAMHAARIPSAHRDLHAAVVELRQRRTARAAGAALVGDSNAMRRARRQVQLAAGLRGPVLVTGSDAWQRRRVAEAIGYAQHSSAGEVVVPFECPLLDENLLVWSLESVAERGREPLTLLLHDVHELPPDAQRFLAERMGRWPESWRLVATCTSLDADEASQAPFDARLFHWLSTLVIDLPPLAARIEDLPLLCQYLVEEANAASGNQISGFSQAALDRMHLFDWPGGLVQLREAVAAAHIAARGHEISTTDLPPLLKHVEAAAAFPSPESTEPIKLEELLAGIETSLIRRALEQSDGNKTQAAALLGMTRPRLYRRMEQLEME